MFARETPARIRRDDWEAGKVRQRNPQEWGAQKGAVVESRDTRTATEDAPSDVHERLEERISEALEIVELEEDWDGEGASEYDRETFERATGWLRGLFEHIADIERRGEVTVALPKIQSGPQGSIDIHWEQPDFELLINIPPEGEGSGEYYGDDYGETVIKGALNGDRRLIASWLASRD